MKTDCVEHDPMLFLPSATYDVLDRRAPTVCRLCGTVLDWGHQYSSCFKCDKKGEDRCVFLTEGGCPAGDARLRIANNDV